MSKVAAGRLAAVTFFITMLVGSIVLAFIGAEYGWAQMPLSETRVSAIGIISAAGASAMTAVQVLAASGGGGPVAPSEIADKVALSVSQRESAQYRQLIDTYAPMELLFRRVPDFESQQVAAPDQGRLSEISTFYRAVASGRLVVVGPGGSGKTVLLLRLLLQLLHEREPGTPIPYRFSLSAWNTTQPLNSWLAAEIARENGIALRQALVLVEAGLVLPLLDGLDEMDFPDAPSPRRAEQAVHQLRMMLRHGQPGPLVVTCRAEAYETLVRRRAHLTDAAVVTMLELTAEQARERINATSADTDRWHGVLSRLVTSPGGPLARQLRLPWHLAIVIALYEERADGRYLRDPLDLAEIRQADVDIRLLPLYAEALLRRQALGGGTGAARRTLATIARYLVANLRHGYSVGGMLLPTVNVVTHQLWPVAGLRAPRITTVLITLLLWAPSGMTIAWLLSRMDWSPTLRISVAAVLLLFPLLSVRSSLAWWPHPRNIVLARLHRRPGQLRLLFSVAASVIMGGLLAVAGRVDFAVAASATFALVFGSGIALAVRDTADVRALVATGTTVGLVLGLVGRLAIGILGGAGGVITGAGSAGLALIASVAVAIRAPTALPGYVSMPVFEDFVRNDLRTGCTAGVLTALIVAPLLTLLPDLRATPMEISLSATSVAISVGLGMVADTWRRHVATLLCAHGHLALRMNRVLAGAYEAGLLRRAGIAYQFRHVELRDYFSELA